MSKEEKHNRVREIELSQKGGYTWLERQVTRHGMDIPP